VPGVATCVAIQCLLSCTLDNPLSLTIVCTLIQIVCLATIVSFGQGFALIREPLARFPASLETSFILRTAAEPGRAF
jgi:hypothetical protein